MVGSSGIKCLKICGFYGVQIPHLWHFLEDGVMATLLVAQP